MNPSADNAPPGPPAPAGGGEVGQAVEHLFRHESGRILAILTRIFGTDHLSLAEDVVQEALVRAMRTWPYQGVPQNPSAWILRAARNLALDTVRREKVFRDKEGEIIRLTEERESGPVEGEGPEREIADDRLRMMFVCCHPRIAAEDQVALTLKTLCGFSPKEISRAFLTTEAAITKRLTRAKQKLREARIPFEIPVGEELRRRLDGVLRSLYLLFNEGYSATSGDRLVRTEICEEAIRLTTLLAGHPAGNVPRTQALLALLLLNAARLPARTDDNGNLLRLMEQDRSRWDSAMIARGMQHLAVSAAGQELSSFHLEAGISACHCAAADFASTNWRQILELYDRLIEIENSPVVALNRTVVVAQIEGPEAGLRAVQAIRSRDSLEAYHLFHAVLGEFTAQLGRPAEAAIHWREALRLTDSRSEREFLGRRLRTCEAGVTSGAGGESPYRR